MGADNTWSGRVTITPPLTWAEVKGSPAVADVRLDLHEEDGPDGKIVTAVAVVPTRSSNAWGQGTGDDLQAVIDAHPGHEFAGYLQVDWDPGLGGDPAHRYVVRGRRVEKVTPVLVWPGGESEPRLAQVWSISGATYDYPERFATRELAQAAAEIQWCNENDPHAEPVFEWFEGEEPGVYEAHIGGVALEWSVRAQPLIWSRDDEEGI